MEASRGSGDQSPTQSHKRDLEIAMLLDAQTGKKTKKKSALFEDGRKTKRLHFIYVLINRSMGAFTVLCLCLSLITKEYELKDIKSANSKYLSFRNNSERYERRCSLYSIH